MTHKYIAAICVSSLAAGAAFAANQTLPVAVGDAFYISGSTALNNQLYADLLQVGGVCAAGTISVYTNNAPIAPAVSAVPKAHQVAIVCDLAAAQFGLLINTPVAFVKESNGGSNEGTNNVANAIALPFLDATIATTGCVANANNPIAPANSYAHAQSFTEFNSCTNITNIAPTFGVADENPQLFNVGQDAINAGAIGKLNSTLMFQNDFAVAVSLNAYRALQRQQGLAATDTLATMPSLSAQQVAGLYTGTLDWSGVTDANGVGLNVAPYAVPAVAAQNYLCRRGDTSGTNVSADVFFLRNRCTAQRFPMLPATTTVANCGGLPLGPPAETPTNFGCTWAAVNLADTTFAGTSGSDVVSCITAHDAASQFSMGVLGDTSKFATPLGAGGVAPGDFRYVAINGAKPNLLSVANGTYTYFMDNVINVPKTLAGVPLAVASFVQTSLQSAIPLSDTFVAQTNAGDANYVTGGLLDATTGAGPHAIPVTLAQLTANPTSPFTMQPTGVVDNCQSPIPAIGIRTVQAPAGN
jgi:hypothetical protein